MTQLATAGINFNANVETALPGLNEADQAIMAGLAEAAIKVDANYLQDLLDTATYAPNGTSHWEGPPDPKATKNEQASWQAGVAARAAVKSNVVYRVAPAADVTKALDADQIYARRRHTSLVTPGDKDRYRQAGSALLWSLARHITGQSVHRRPDDDNRTPWGYR
jgi:hypothetical protein